MSALQKDVGIDVRVGGEIPGAFRGDERDGDEVLQVFDFAHAVLRFELRLAGEMQI